MDVETAIGQLSAVLANTYNPVQTIREDAERQLQSFLNISGSASVLLTIMSRVSTAPRDLRLSAALVMKNSVKEFWCSDALMAENISRGGTVKTRNLSAEERQSAKAALVDILLNETDSAMRKCLAETIKKITEWDPPESTWPELLPALVGNITLSDGCSPLRVYNAVVGIRKVLKRYQFSQEKRRELFDGMIQLVFPQLQTLSQQLSGVHSVEAASVLHVSLKIFYSSVMNSLPRVQSVDITFWFNLLATLTNKSLPEASENLEPLGQPERPEERELWPWWKVKKWATNIAQHLFMRYGNPKGCKEENEAFCKYFKDHGSMTLLGPIMNQLQLKAQGRYISEAVHRNCLSFMSSAVELSTTYKAIKPYMAFFIGNVVVPSLCIKADEIAMFQEDPLEFVRKHNDIMEEFSDPGKMAQNLLQALVRYRTKDSLQFVLDHVMGVMQRFHAAGAAAQLEHYRELDGAIVAVASISKFLLDSKKKKNLKERQDFVSYFVSQQLVPCLSSPQGVTRFRACWAIEYLDDFQWGDGDGSQTGMLQAVLHGLLTGLRDPALPVQVAAAKSMRTMLNAAGAADLLRPMLGDIVSEYFRITADIEGDLVLETLDHIVEKFPDEMSALAPMMVQHLMTRFAQFLSVEGDEEDESQWAAAQCLSTITAVLETQSDKPAVLVSLEPLICPLVLHLMNSGQAFNFIDQCMDLVFYLSGSGKGAGPLSPQMWSLCGPLLLFLRDEGFDCLEDVRPCISTFITRDIATFVTGSYGAPIFAQPGTEGVEPGSVVGAAPPVSFAEMLHSIAAQALRSDSSIMEQDVRLAVGLLYVLIGSGREMQCLHSVVPAVLQLVLPRLLGEQPYSPIRPLAPGDTDDTPPGTMLGCKSKPLRVKILEVILACFHYNTPLTTAVLAQDGPRFAATFRILFDSLPKMDQPVTQRLVVMAFTSILATDDSTKAALPDEVRANFGPMLKQCIRELEQLRENQCDEPCKEEDGYDDEDDEDDDDDVDFDEEDEDDDEDDDDEEDEGDDGNGVAAARRRAEVPEGGYGEDEDVGNAEDQSYLDRLGVYKSVKYNNGEAEDGDDDPFSLPTPLDKHDVLLFFVDTLSASPAAPSLQATLGPQDLTMLGGHLQAAQERRAGLLDGAATGGGGGGGSA